MARVLIATQSWGILWSTDGDAVVGGGKRLKIPQAGQLAAIDTTVYSGPAGGGTVAPAAFVTDANGVLPGYVEQGAHTLTINGVGVAVEAVSAAAVLSLESSSATHAASITVLNEALPLIPGLVNEADNTAAIIDWHDDLPPEGGAGRMPPGLFHFDGAAAHVFDKPTEIRGAGPTATELRNSDTNGQHFLWFRADRCGVHDMYVNGMKDDQTVDGGSAVNFAGTGADPQALTFIKDVKMSNVRVSGNGFDCVGLVAVDGFDLTDVDCDDIFDTGLDLVEGTKNGTIKGGVVRCAGRWGVGMDTAYEQTVGQGTTTNGSATITGLSSTLGYFWPGQKVAGAGIPVGATVLTAVAGSGTMTISANATASGTVAITAIGYTKVRNVKVIGTTVVMESGPDNRHAFLAQSAEMVTFEAVTADLSAAGIVGLRVDQDSRLVSVTDPTVIGGNTDALYGVQFEGLATEYSAAVAQGKQSSLIGGDIMGFDGSTRGGVQLDNVIGVTIKGTKVRDCQRGFNVEGTSARPSSDVLIDGTQAVGCDTSYRFGGTTGANKARLVNAQSRYATSFDLAIDTAWTVRQMGEPLTAVFNGGSLIRETIDAWLALPAVSAGSVPNNAVFRDISDNVIKVKNNSGVVTAI